MGRRGNGEGTIRQRGDGRWEAKIAFGLTARGNPKTKSVYGKTKTEVVAKLTTLRKKLGSGVSGTEAQTMTVDAYLEHYLEVRGPRLDENTLTTYRNYFRAYVKPHIGAVKLGKLSELHLEMLLNKLRQSGKGIRVQKYTLTLLRSALRYAVRWRMLEQSPAEHIDMPRGETKPKIAWNATQAKAFLRRIRHDRLYSLYMTLILTGLRRSEVLGLKVGAVNLDELWLEVSHTVVYSNGKRLERDKAKSIAGRRRFRISPKVARILRARLEERELERDLAGEKWLETGYIWTDLTGAGIHEHALRDHYDSVVSELSFPRITFREMRHTYLSLINQRGVNLKVAQFRAGHADSTTTLNVYTHHFDEDDEAAAAILDDLIEDPEIG